MVAIVIITTFCFVLCGHIKLINIGYKLGSFTLTYSVSHLYYKDINEGETSK